MSLKPLEGDLHLKMSKTGFGLNWGGEHYVKFSKFESLKYFFQYYCFISHQKKNLKNLMHTLRKVVFLILL